MDLGVEKLSFFLLTPTWLKPASQRWWDVSPGELETTLIQAPSSPVIQPDSLAWDGGGRIGTCSPESSEEHPGFRDSFSGRNRRSLGPLPLPPSPTLWFSLRHQGLLLRVVLQQKSPVDVRPTRPGTFAALRQKSLKCATGRQVAGEEQRQLAEAKSVLGWERRRQRAAGPCKMGRGATPRSE